MSDAMTQAIETIANGGLIVLSEVRDGVMSATLTTAADRITPDKIEYMAQNSYGLIRLGLTEERCAELGLSKVLRAGDGSGSVVSITAMGTAPIGASYADRALTIRMAADERIGAEEFRQPGHVFVVEAREGGVLRRDALIEAAVDMARLAGCAPASAMSLVLNEDGTVAGAPEIESYCDRLGVPLISVADVVTHRRRREKLVQRVARVRMPTVHSDFRAVAYKEIFSNAYHVAMVKGEVDGERDVLVRVHAACLPADVFGSTSCACRRNLDAAFEQISTEGRGVVIYLLGGRDRTEELLHGVDSGGALPIAVEQYEIGAQILSDLGVSTIRVLMDDSTTPSGFQDLGLEIADRVPLLHDRERTDS